MDAGRIYLDREERRYVPLESLPSGNSLKKPPENTVPAYRNSSFAIDRMLVTPAIFQEGGADGEASPTLRPAVQVTFRPRLSSALPSGA
jgi:hypothetical protein